MQKEARKWSGKVEIVRKQTEYQASAPITNPTKWCEAHHSQKKKSEKKNKMIKKPKWKRKVENHQGKIKADNEVGDFKHN